ncbi:hypothetical protein [Rhodococcus sp. ARC_M6]|uniref:hypothetical protein n=1 Tax=Rhodococcus sp. ARC_M6 TaxID=2928852 RepID=UPI001FB34C28|nr:hypothetical protein [Rhodococcus sp. ARC_M6]MCJ0901935.1 hypothetical protein [Rhodococcus sp. ARC_M6]
MFDLRRARAGKLSVRSLIAVAGVAAATFGLAQATGTMANPTDAVSTTGSQLATGNFYPTLITPQVTCKELGTAGIKRVTVSWGAVQGATQYRLKIVRDNNPNEVLANDVYPASQLSRTDFRISSYKGAYARVYTINNGVESSGWRGIGIQSATGVDTWCTNNPSYSANQTWEDTHVWDPATPDPNGSAARGVAPEAMEMDSDQDVTDETTAGETATPDPTTTTTAPASTTTEPPTSSTATPGTTTPGTTTPDATTSPETTPTENPKLVLTGTVESGGLTAGWTAGGNKVAVVDADGKELASGRVESGSTLHWNNGQLWIVGATEVYRIMESPQDGKWKFYTDSGQNMPDFE